MNRLRFFMRFVFYYSGGLSIYRKFVPNRKDNKLPTGFIWIVGLYFAAYAFTNHRYENNLDKVEFKYTIFTTQLGAGVPFSNNRLIEIIQEDIPVRPVIYRPITILESFFYGPFYFEQYYQANKNSKGKKFESANSFRQEIISQWSKKLEGADFRYAQLEGADFRYAQLEGADFGCDIPYPFLGIFPQTQQTKLNGANFEGAQLNGANFNGARLKEADFDGAQLEGANFDNTQLKEVNLEHVSENIFFFKGRNFNGASFQRAQFKKGANFEHALLNRANFNEAQLEEANFKGARLEKAKFGSNFITTESGAQLKGADFRGSYLIKANFWKAQLEGANFGRLRFTPKQMRSQPKRINAFEDTQLEGANFRQAQLKEANFEHAQLKEADFSFAQLEGADFRYAQLEGADFEGARLERVKGLTARGLIKAKNIYGIKKCPQDILEKIKKYGCTEMLDAPPSQWSKQFIEYRKQLISRWEAES